MTENELSREGRARRQQIKEDCAQRVASIRGRQRRVRNAIHGTVAVAVLACLVTMPWSQWGRTPIDRAPVGLGGGNPPVSAIAHHEPRAPLRIETIDNDRLLELLAEAGRPSALGRIDGKLVVLPAATSF